MSYIYCTCHRAWFSVTPPPPCPTHGTFSHPQTWASPNTVQVGIETYVGRHRK